ncbi:MAG TPA: IPT/TIG domain-containing protein [Luteitalea sp.]|nr:IPT/TIG domain-containing protein [Luteitalea sp.]
MHRAMTLATLGVCALAATFLAQPVEAAGPDLKTWYFAEGSTAPVLPFEQEILLGNPTPEAATVNLRFFPQDGGAPVPVTLEVRPYSRLGINARQFMPNNFGFSLEVTSTASIVVERSMYWGGGLFNFGTAYNGGAIIDMRAGHNAVGVTALNTTWSFAEGSAGFFDTYVLVSNPGVLAANVQVKYLTSQGEQVTVNDVVPSGQRRTYFANDALKAQLGPRAQFDFAIEVTSDVGVVAERAMYWNGFQGGHATVGVTPQPTWLFAEGAQFDNALSTYVLLFNPNTEPITVQTSFYGPDGLLEPVVQQIPARSRAQIYAGEYPRLRNQSFSISSESVDSKPYVAERAVYKAGGPTLGEGTVTAGLTMSALKWGFAEGAEGGFAQYQNPADADRRLFTSYYLVLNDTSATATVRGVFYLEPCENPAVCSPVIPTGSGFEVTIPVNPKSRGTFAPQLYPALHNRKFAAFFESDVPIAMERAVYWGNGIKGAHASTGTALPDTLPTLVAPTAPPPPTIASISPNRGAPSGGTVTTITGTGIGLKQDLAVSFGVTPVPAANIIVNNANSITVVTPASGRGVSNVVVTSRGTTLELPAAFEFLDKNAAAGAPWGRYNGQFSTFCKGDGSGCSELPNGVNGFSLAATVAAGSRGDLLNSCKEFGGNNRWLYDAVARLRLLTGSNRWGLNWKRGNVGDQSQDIITYFWGEEGESMRNNAKVYLMDTIGGHCGNNPSPNWEGVTFKTFGTRFTGSNAGWTTDGMCAEARYRDAKYPNGEWLFPECRP